MELGDPFNALLLWSSGKLNTIYRYWLFFRIYWLLERLLEWSSYFRGSLCGALIASIRLILLLYFHRYLILAVIEVFFYSLNEWICLKVLKVVDVGGSIYLHAFAAYFGLALSMVLHRPKVFMEELKQLKFGSKLNELLAMVGTLFLFIYWPSFNSVFAPADLQNRAVINTAVSLLASCVGAFAASALFSKDKFSMVGVSFVE